MNVKNSERGLLSLEACISVTIFLFLMLFLYSFFIVFEARNEMAHVLLASTNSLAFDAYENANIQKAGTAAQLILGNGRPGGKDQHGFMTNNGSWYESEGTSDKLNAAVKERFIAYLANGDQKEADRILKRYHIVGGIEGLDFSESQISSENLYVVLRYSLEYEFRVFDLGKISFKQSACSKLWN